jgi:hypothetical protein
VPFTSHRSTLRIVVLAAGFACVTALTATGTASAAANGCTGEGFPYQNVCISISGASTLVTKVAIGNNTGKAGTGTVTVNGKTKWNLGTIKAHGRTGLNVHVNLPNNAKVCAHIKGVDGAACETIKK